MILEKKKHKQKKTGKLPVFTDNVYMLNRYLTEPYSRNP
ncbi:hypothetical protein SMQ301_0619 [Streptococcus thermophilus]|nr:hypothetical protein SMQ301_0619 [Streptococcus thermophilus]